MEPKLRVVEHPYSRMFFLRNRDPANYVLNRDFFFYSILGLYLFLLWYLVLVFKNYDFLSRTDEGGIVWYFALIAAVMLFLVFLFSFYRTQSNTYPILGLGYTLLLLSMAILLFNFEKNEIDRGFEHDPVQQAYVFLTVYSFVSFFMI